MKNAYLPEQLSKLQAQTSKVRELFGGLSESQLNWQPSAEQWSIGLCLEHLIRSNSTYFPVLQAIGDGTARMGFWTKVSPFSNYFGNMLLKATGPVVKQKMKAPPAFKPVSSEVGPDIVPRFEQHQIALVNLLRRTDSIGHTEFKIPSPAMGLITYRLDVAVNILAQHEERHVLQAERVLKHPEFPK